MNPHDPLPIGTVTFTPYTREEQKAFLLDDTLPRNMLARQKALTTIVSIVKRLVETATFTLSAEDFSTLEQALNAYEASQ